IHEHWRVLERRGGSARLSHRLAHYLGERKQHGDRWETALEQANCPISFIWGMSDPRSGAHIAEEIRRRLPLAPLVELPDVGHYPQLEVPDAVASEIAAALDRELPAGRGFPAMVPEAPLVETGSGLVPAGEGWFVLNAREARWRHREGRGERLPFEGELEFPQVGVGLYVLAPGEPI